MIVFVVPYERQRLNVILTVKAIAVIFIGKSSGSDTITVAFWGTRSKNSSLTT